ncbi:MAG TPA: heme-binding domain-containing protein [Rhodothermales bacterium]|nr:heme-binding domain-containing protein [Rhodothermales bacterium]
MKKKVYGAILAVLGLFILMQLIPIDRENPAVTLDMPAPKPVKDILKRACYDCHSNETKWPWYSYLAPVKFMIRHHIDEGRNKVNFSTWDQPQGEEKAEIPEEIIEVIEKGEMPTWDYILMHAEAKLSNKDVAVLKQWAATTDKGGERGETGDDETTATNKPTHKTSKDTTLVQKTKDTDDE